MVLGQLVRPVVAKQIDAAVAHVREDGVLSASDERDERRPHPALAAVRGGQRVHLGARLLHRALDELRGVLAVLQRGGSRERLENRALVGKRVAQRLHRRRAGNFARRMAAHSIGDRVQPESLVHQVSIFVVRALLADVRACPAANDRHRADLTMPQIALRRAASAACGLCHSSRTAARSG